MSEFAPFLADNASPPLLARLTSIVGRRHVLTGRRATGRFDRGIRFGSGPVAMVVRPGSLVEMWRVLQEAVAAGCAIIVQAANTGLTGGSTPWGDDYGRPVLLINVMRLKGLHQLAGGEQVLCLAGATLDELEQALKPIGREPHSVIGSSCLGASVIGGICNNSGGALVKRGPAYTEMALYAARQADGSLTLINELGLDLGTDPEDILARLDRGQIPLATKGDDWGSDRAYADHVRDIAAATPARFNADPRRLRAASGCAGKLAVFAVRLDTFEAEPETAVFYIGTNDPNELTRIRRDILSGFGSLPISGEYLHRDAYDIAEIYGKDTFLLLRWLGTQRIQKFFALKERMDSLTRQWGLGGNITDKVAQALFSWLPGHLPARMSLFRDRYQHHLLLRMGGAGISEARSYLATMFPSAQGDVFECTQQEGAAAFLHRFATAGAANRYRAVHSRHVEDIVALDIALRRNDENWVETLPPELDAVISKKLYYGHFFCHVFHQDYVVKKGHNCMELEEAMCAILDARGAEYPAEHNVGHLYHAKPDLAAFYRQQDPTNSFNPGIGCTSIRVDWA